jgi:ABC-type antimicrobial peptide transport system permease subunit
LRTATDPVSFIPAIRRELRSVDPAFPVAQIRTMDEIVGDSLSQRRFNAALFALFAFVAVALAGVGIYAVTSYSVTQRTREMGIRTALGAKQFDITKLVTLSGARLAAAGIAIGIVATTISGRLLSSLLFDVTPTDPVTFVFTSTLLGAITLLASYIPARRAARTNPIAALHYD